MKVNVDPNSITQDPNESARHIENFNNAMGTARALDPISTKAFENTSGRKGVILYDPHLNPNPESDDDKSPTYLPTHIFDSGSDPQRSFLIQNLRAKAIEDAIKESEDVPKVVSSEETELDLNTDIKNKLRQTTSGLIQKQMQLIESNPNVKKSVLSQLANQGLIAGHTPSSIAKIKNPQDVNLLYSRLTSSDSQKNFMKEYVRKIAAKQLGDRIKSYPGTDLQVLIKNRRDTSDNTGLLEKLAETLTFLSQIGTASQSKGKKTE